MKPLTAASADGWNHSAHYHAVLLASVPRPCHRALDVGCGLGAFARRVARIADRVDAIDREAIPLGYARELSSTFDNLRFIEADFLTWDGAPGYDFMSFIATLHHLPFAEALSRASELLRPGGRLAVLGLHRASSLLALGARSVVAYPVSWGYRLVAPVGAPVVDPTMTLGEIRRHAKRVVPGAMIRRHLLWRYSLLWTKPAR